MGDQGRWARIEADRQGERLDTALARLSEGLSRSRVQKLIDSSFVKVNGTVAKANYRLEPGDKIDFFLPDPKPIELKAEEIPLEILFEDEHLAVIEKPAGMVVHPGAGRDEGTLVNALLHHFKDLSSGTGIGGELRPGIVHRIDRNTSGILLVTKTDLAHQNLSLQFKEHSISRHYLGLCWGPLPESGEWNGPIARDPKERKRMAVIPSGRRAITHFRRLETLPGPLAYFEARLLTGRTHQIRVHFSHHGYPLAGDSVYGSVNRKARKAAAEGINALRRKSPDAARLLEQLEAKGRQFLHAAHLEFVHPASGAKMMFHSDLPAGLQEIMLSLRACSR